MDHRQKAGRGSNNVDHIQRVRKRNGSRLIVDREPEGIEITLIVHRM